MWNLSFWRLESFFFFSRQHVCPQRIFTTLLFSHDMLLYRFLYQTFKARKRAYKVSAALHCFHSSWCAPLHLRQSIPCPVMYKYICYSWPMEWRLIYHQDLWGLIDATCCCGAKGSEKTPALRMREKELAMMRTWMLVSFDERGCQPFSLWKHFIPLSAFLLSFSTHFLKRDFSALKLACRNGIVSRARFYATDG